MAGVCEEECMGRSPGDEPQTLTKCHNCRLPKGGSPFVAEPKGHKGEISVFLLFLKLCFSFTVDHFII